MKQIEKRIEILIQNLTLFPRFPKKIIFNIRNDYQFIKYNGSKKQLNAFEKKLKSLISSYYISSIH